MKLFNKSFKIVIFTLTVSLFFTACGITKKEDKNKGLEKKYETEENSKDETKEKVKKETEEETEKETEKETETKKEAKVMKNTAVNDGNLVGNMVCYGRMVNNGDVYYFRNPKDQERTYSVDMKGNISRLPGDIYMKDMHILNGNIYYANTSVGDQQDNNFTDRNIYKYSISTGENTKVTNLDFGVGNDSWLSF